jgi:hypothetical protein
VLKPVSGLGFEYVVIIHHVTAEKKSKQTEGATTYRPLFGGITLNQDGETQVTGKMSFTTTIISVGSNSPVYVFSQTPELCGSDAEQCIAGHAVNGIIQKKQPPKPATGAEPGKPSASPSIGLYNGASAMFVMGSVLTFIGLGTVVYGNTTASISLFAAGQTGLLMCGLSNIMIRSAITSTGGVPPPGGNSAGWILHGSSVVLMGTGVGLVIAATSKGVSGNQVPVLLFSGVGTIIVGEALLPFSWIAHLKYRKKLKNVYQNISFDPVWNVDVAGRNEFGGKVTVGF